jgi:hypothetical protein
VNEKHSDPGMNADDRTLLIRVDVKLSNLIGSFEEFKKERITKIESRLDSAEQKLWLFTGGLVVLNALVYFVPHFLK